MFLLSEFPRLVRKFHPFFETKSFMIMFKRAPTLCVCVYIYMYIKLLARILPQMFPIFMGCLAMKPLRSSPSSSNSSVSSHVLPSFVRHLSYPILPILVMVSLFVILLVFSYSEPLQSNTHSFYHLLIYITRYLFSLTPYS